MPATFQPSAHAFKFVNSWPSEPDVVVNVAGIGNVAIGNASNGLCGGMVFACLDFFEARLPVVPDGTNPAEGSPLFKYIVGRLFDSFNIPDGVLKYYSWMNTPDHDTGLWFAIRRGVAWMTIMEELPKIRADIDAGSPSPLGLVTVYSTDPTMIGHNHQVLAYGYRDDGNGNVTVQLYDPNSGANDGVYLALNVSNPSHTTLISHNVDLNGLPIRGFFRVNYGAHDPSSLEPRPPPPLPGPRLDVSVKPYPVTVGRPVTLTVSAQDSGKHTAVAGSVLLDGRPAATIGQPFTHTFLPRVIRPRRPLDDGPVVSYPIGTVSAPGYPLAPVDFGFPET
jgi:hypothetical protein